MSKARGNTIIFPEEIKKMGQKQTYNHFPSIQAEIKCIMRNRHTHAGSLLVTRNPARIFIFNYAIKGDITQVSLNHTAAAHIKLPISDYENITSDNNTMKLLLQHLHRTV